jgi:hypothetical protein
MYVVPNHLLEQFSREFRHSSPIPTATLWLNGISDYRIDS